MAANPQPGTGQASSSFLRDEQYAALAQATAAIGVWLRTLFELGVTSGIGKGELLGLRVRQINFEEQLITLNPGETKNGKGRDLPMSSKVFELISELIRGKAPEDYVFTRERTRAGRQSRNGGRIVKMREEWRQATEAAGCPGLLFRNLRRTGRDREKHNASSLNWYHAHGAEIRQRRKEHHRLERAAKGIIEEPKPAPAPPDELCQLVRELTCRCGLSMAQMRELRLTHIEPNGLGIPPTPKSEKPGRLVPFGNGPDELQKTILDAYITKEKPTDYLFFSRSPRQEETANCEGCGCEFVKTKRTQRFHSRKCGQITRDKKRWSKRRSARLSGALLERYRSDPHYQQVGGDNFVICRECGGPYPTLYAHIPDAHKMTGKEYRRQWPGAPLATENVKAAKRQQAKLRLDRLALEEEPEKKKKRLAKARDYQSQYRATHVEELKKSGREYRKLNRDAVNKRNHEHRIANRDEINRRQREQHAANRDERNAQQRAARADDPERFKEYGQKSYAKHRTQRVGYAAKRRQVTWRPTGWKSKPPIYRIIGIELIEEERQLNNKQLAAKLDRADVRCPYAKTWQDALQDRAFQILVSRVRKFVKRPGKGRPSRVSIHS